LVESHTSSRTKGPLFIAGTTAMGVFYRDGSSLGNLDNSDL
jgi:hypothetical protein